MIESARANDIDVILIRQALRMMPHADYARDSVRLRRYANRLAYAESLLTADGRITPEHSTTINHAALIAVVDSLGRTYGIPVVDNIAIVDEHPEYFASYVHLTEDANDALAEALVPVVLRILEGRNQVARGSPVQR
jgi:lysophospholipase L1-like esterase